MPEGNSESGADAAAYLDGKKYVQQGLLATAEQFDKAILTLAAGAFGLSIAFLKDIAPEPLPWTKCLLAAAWGGFLASIASTLFSFQAATESFAEYERFIDERRAFPDKPPVVLGDAKNAMTANLNRFSLFSFLFGAVLLAAFSFSNLNSKGTPVAGSKPGSEQHVGRLTEGAVTARPSIMRAVPAMQVQAGAVVAGPPVVGGEVGRGAVVAKPPVGAPQPPAVPPPSQK